MIARQALGKAVKATILSLFLKSLVIYAKNIRDLRTFKIINLTYYTKLPTSVYCGKDSIDGSLSDVQLPSGLEYTKLKSWYGEK